MRKNARPKHPRVAHPRAVAMPVAEVDSERTQDTPFAEGAGDELDADLRHRLIGDAAYALYCQRGYVDGFDVDDWLEAEAKIDHLLLHPAESGSQGQAAG